MTAYYNENDPKTASWLRALVDGGHVTPGLVDDRSIVGVGGTDPLPHTRVHLFAGIGGWDLALSLAGWPADRPVWTGSCPCQPFSVAGRGKGDKDPRHLWPEMFRLIRECRPALVLGEQVASAIGHGWWDGVCADLEGEGYACGATVLGAHSVGAPHIRQRLFWCAHSTEHGREWLQRCPSAQVSEDWTSETLAAWHIPGDPFADWKKLLARSCVRKLADGVSSTMVVRPALRGYGNAIIPQVAAVFIRAVMEELEVTPSTLNPSHP